MSNERDKLDFFCTDERGWHLSQVNEWLPRSLRYTEQLLNDYISKVPGQFHIKHSELVQIQKYLEQSIALVNVLQNKQQRNALGQ